MSSFYSQDELKSLGLGSVGSNVLISKMASIYMPEALFLGDNVRIDDFCVIVGGAGIHIGRFVHIACFCGLFGGAGIEMEDFSGLSSKVTIYSESDDYNGDSLTNPTVPKKYKPNYVSKKVCLKKHSIVGAHSVILPGVTLNEGVAIGANSLVMRDCDAWSVYFGSPAKKVKARSRDLLRLENEFKQLLNGEVQTSS